KYAVKNRLIKSNPGQDIVIPKRTVTVDELESDELQSFYFERHELDLFLKEVINLGMRLDKEWFYTLAFSGMRPDEMIALKKQDLNYEDNTIRVSKTMYNEENTIKGYMLNTTKTNQMRTIGMSPKVMQMLKYLVRKNDVHKMKYRRQITDFHDADFVFQRKNGYPYTTQNVYYRMKRVLKLIKIKKKLTPHSFRHTHITMLAESGTDLSTIMERVGHVDPNTTLKVYTHITDKMKKKSIKNIDLSYDHILDNLGR